MYELVFEVTVYFLMFRDKTAMYLVFKICVKCHDVYSAESVIGSSTGASVATGSTASVTTVFSSSVVTSSDTGSLTSISFDSVAAGASVETVGSSDSASVSAAIAASVT